MPNNIHYFDRSKAISRFLKNADVKLLELQLGTTAFQATVIYAKDVASSWRIT
jgi:hypothetical protein